ncbi:MAG: hypothetical protein JST20_12105 [Bacteroidetes bacterium]|nr:hypothetical protein [Bacteroidota bacterium]
MMSTIYGSVTNNHKIDDFSFGYGLSYGRNNWSYKDFGRTDTIIPLRESKYKSHLSAGLLLSTYYQLGYYFNIGLVYRPTFIRFVSANTLQYEHIISVDFAWKIPLLQ